MRFYTQTRKHCFGTDMSGSPIGDSDYRAIGVVTTGGGSPQPNDDCREGGPNPPLSDCLPGWISQVLDR